MMTDFRIIQGILWLIKSIIVYLLYEKYFFHGNRLTVLVRILQVVLLAAASINLWTIRQFSFPFAYLFEIAVTVLFLVITNRKICDQKASVMKLIAFTALLESCFSLAIVMVTGIIQEPELGEGNTILLILSMTAIIASGWFTFSVFSKNFESASIEQLTMLVVPICSCYFFVGSVASNAPGLHTSLLVMGCSILSVAYEIWMKKYMKQARETQSREQYEAMEKHFREQKELVEQEREAYADLRHSMKDHIFIIQSLQNEGKIEQAQDYVKGISSQIDFPTDRFYCHDAILNTLLNIQKGIHPDIHYDIQICRDPEFLVSQEWTEVIFLLLNNSAEELEAHPELSGIISMSLFPSADGAQLTVWNESHCVKSLKTEKTGEGHGTGLKRAQKIAGKYGGFLTVEQSDGFMVTVVFRNPQTDRKPAALQQMKSGK